MLYAENTKSGLSMVSYMIFDIYELDNNSRRNLAYKYPTFI